MDLIKRKSLTQSLSKLSAEIAAALRTPMLASGPIQDAAQALHREEQVGEAFDLWTDLLSRRAAVLWVLKSLYVRILEDRGLLQPRRILEAEDELFRYLAPNLGPTAYLRWAYRDLASLGGGLPELFAPQPAELSPVPDSLSQRLIDFWRSKNPDTGELLYRFDDEHFDSRLMGDLYQDLDPVVKKRYALLQTPDFVLDFILDETLTPAIAEWGVEAVRVLDPACGSGHFLLAAFKRIVAGMRIKFPDRSLHAVVKDVLARVVGIDLNDYACGLARARLVMTALETCTETTLATAAAFHPRVFWADALEQVEQDEQLGFTEIAPGHRSSMALLTPPEVRTALRPELKRGFHAVVGNPPYITEKDKRRKAYQTAKVGKGKRYLSAVGRYSLGAPFIERALQLGLPGARLGLIVANSFARREYGKALVCEVLLRHQVTAVIDTAGAYLPGHGTPTLLLLISKTQPRSDTLTTIVTGKRGETGIPLDPARARVWTSLIGSFRAPPREDEFSASGRPLQTILADHPWSVGAGVAGEIVTAMNALGQPLSQWVDSIGYDVITSASLLVEQTATDYARLRIEPAVMQRYTTGESVRDWDCRQDVVIPVAYEPTFRQPLDIARLPGLRAFLWPHRTWLGVRFVSGGTTMADVGLPYWAIPQLPWRKHATPLVIAFGQVATHNHFGIDRSGSFFKQTAPIIKFKPASEGDADAILGLLNSSIAELWMKSVYQPKGGDSVGDEGARVTGEPWEERYQRDGTKLGSFPVPELDQQLAEFALSLTAHARARTQDSVHSVLSGRVVDASSLRALLAARRDRDTKRLLAMVALQEELDWFCYRLYGVDVGNRTRGVRQLSELQPGSRPFEIILAREDAERREAISRGEEPEEGPTEWFARHGWPPQITSATLPPSEASVVQARIERTQVTRELGVLEQPAYKRRWYKPDYEKEERQALGRWLDDRLEAWGKERSEPFTAAHAGSALRSDHGILAVGELLTGRSDFDVDLLIEERLRLSAVPNSKHHVFKPEGLLKRAAWERTWEEQHKEDRGEPAHPEAPEKYAKEDFLRKEYWDLRGKLDVPKERFVAFTEVPPPVGAATLYGWAGWTPRERAKAMLGLDERLEAAGVPVVDRHGLLYGVWFLLPYVAWESPEAARDFRADVKSLVGENGVTEAMLEEWAKRFPPPKGGKGAKPKAATVVKPRKSKVAAAKEEESS